MPQLKQVKKKYQGAEHRALGNPQVRKSSETKRFNQEKNVFGRYDYFFVLNTDHVLIWAPNACGWNYNQLNVKYSLNINLCDNICK